MKYGNNCHKGAKSQSFHHTHSENERTDWACLGMEATVIVYKPSQIKLRLPDDMRLKIYTLIANIL